MYSYLTYASLLLLLFILYLVLKRMASSPHKSDPSTNNLADEKANGSLQHLVPGDSPAYYTGDPSNDVLEIKSLDLRPNPPTE